MRASHGGAPPLKRTGRFACRTRSNHDCIDTARFLASIESARCGDIVCGWTGVDAANNAKNPQTSQRANLIPPSDQPELPASAVSTAFHARSAHLTRAGNLETPLSARKD